MLKIPMHNIWIELNSLSTVSLIYGQDSEEMTEATNLLKSALNDLVSTLDAVFNRRVCLLNPSLYIHLSSNDLLFPQYILSVITNDQGLVRERREAPRAGNGTVS